MRCLTRSVKSAPILAHMHSQPSPVSLVLRPSSRPVFDLGRKVFTAATSAAFDDFSLVSDDHLFAAIAYGEEQLVMLPRHKVVLRKLQAERIRRLTDTPEKREMVRVTETAMDDVVARLNAVPDGFKVVGGCIQTRYHIAAGSAVAEVARRSQDGLGGVYEVLASLAPA